MLGQDFPTDDREESQIPRGGTDEEGAVEATSDVERGAFASAFVNSSPSSHSLLSEYKYARSASIAVVAACRSHSLNLFQYARLLLFSSPFSAELQNPLLI